MSIDEKALSFVQDLYVDNTGIFKDMSIRTVIEYYESAKSTEQPVGITRDAARKLVLALRNSQDAVENDVDYLISRVLGSLDPECWVRDSDGQGSLELCNPNDEGAIALYTGVSHVL